MQGLGCTSTNFNNKACHPTGTYNMHTYGKQEPRGPLFTRKCRFAHVQQPNRMEYLSNFSVLGQSFDVLSGIWCEFEVMFFAAGACASIRACACIRTYTVIIHFIL